MTLFLCNCDISTKVFPPPVKIPSAFFKALSKFLLQAGWASEDKNAVAENNEYVIIKINNADDAYAPLLRPRPTAARPEETNP